MNKSQEMEVMVLRAEMKADEAMKQHQQSWYGEEPEIIENVEKVEEE